MPGRLEVVTGCMFAGKSEELLRRLRRAIIARKGVLLAKPDVDWRYGRDQVVSHDGQRLDAQPLPADRPELLLELAARQKPDVVGVDEAQFFAPGLTVVVERLVRQGLRVVVAGLDMDFAGRPFGSMPQLMAMADEVTKLQAVCVVCGEPAVLTQRLLDGRPAPADAPVIVVGGSERYEARCRRHHQLA